jgi:hypothetical protein
MARKIVNRRELRDQADAAAERGEETAKKKPADKEKAPRKSRAKKKTGDVRLKAFWGVFNQSLKRVALYEYSDKRQADKKAAELSSGGKSPHFVKPVKEVIQE